MRLKIMNVTNYPNYYNIQQRQVQPATSMEQLVSMLNKKMEANSPLETAQQALLKAKAKLDEHRNEQIEGALDGYLSLRSRQTSYENGLRVHQEQLESFQTLRGRRDELSSELSAAKADFEAYAATETTLDITQRNRLSLRVTSLECELSSVNQELSTLVKQANCYTKSQRQYADYLENTDQSGYAAFEYRDQGEYTEENFVSQTADMIGCMEAGTKRWRERVSSYCEQYGLTPYDFECYLQERNKLSDAFSIAKQKLSELLYAAEGTAIGKHDTQTVSAQVSTPPIKDNFDTVEISKSALEKIQQAHSQQTEATKIIK